MRWVKDINVFPGTFYIVGILILLTGSTVAFFNYTRIGS